MDPFKNYFHHLEAIYKQLASLPKSIGIAVSGGPDSIFLCHLAKQWCNTLNNPPHLWALTVDHGLRAESYQEALLVKKWVEPLGFNHYILSWEGNKPPTRIQEEARYHRYGLLFDFCHKNNIEWLLTAHHQDDQIETILMRLIKGSGIQGLCGIKEIQSTSFGHLIRPLLNISKGSIIVKLNEIQQPFVSDPSNQKEEFERIRLRHWIAQGPDLKGLLTTSRHLSSINEWLKETQKIFHCAYTRFEKTGYVSIDKKAFEREPTESQAWILRGYLHILSGLSYPPRFQPVYRVLKQLSTKSQTLSGCVVKISKDLIHIYREDRAIKPLNVLKNQTLIWDGRFKITSPETGTIVPLGEKYHSIENPLIPYYARRSLPGLIRDNALEPLLLYSEAEITVLPQNLLE